MSGEADTASDSATSRLVQHRSEKRLLSSAGRSCVSDKIRTRVLEAAEALGYTVPTRGALRTGRAGALGLIARFVTSSRIRPRPHFSGGAALGMEDARSASCSSPTRGIGKPHGARHAAVDGFIVYSAVRNDPRVEAALARGLPVRRQARPRCPDPFLGVRRPRPTSTATPIPARSSDAAGWECSHS